MRNARRLVLALTLLPGLVLWPRWPGLAQTAPSSSEKKPTIKDPRYRAPQLPEHLQQEESAESIILAPGGELDLKRVQRALLKKQERQSRRGGRLKEREYYERLETEAGRRAIERDILDQFGVEEFPYESQGGRHEHSESPGRRFQIVFFLSLPITAAFVGGAISAARQSRGDGGGLTLEESAGALAGGMVFSALIGWYDHNRWIEFQRRRIEAEADPAPAPEGPTGSAGLRALYLAGPGSDTAPNALVFGVQFSY